MSGSVHAGDTAAAFDAVTALAPSGVPLRLPLQLEFVSLQLLLFVAILGLGAAVSYLVVVFGRRLLVRFGVPEAIEGTSFERSVREFGTSTVTIVSRLAGYFTFLAFAVVAFSTAGFESVVRIWPVVVAFLPQVFVAVLVVVVGLIVGDKVALLVDERLRSVKITQVGALPGVAKYSVVFVASLVALAQVRVATLPLVVLLGGYVFAVVVVSVAAFRDLLASGSAGLYLLLTEPYAIGDRVRIGGVEGVVQEMDVFVTHVEDDGEEYLVPNRKALTEGVVRVRE
ncbi:mechanosensitive ion channel domain-containing protein [Halobaculum sp. MBLA0147]|uniref:mechanosensitive ion channel domain-containing protein n=1 Tax=Halobaculum sp. MBLA0147 TaxID=3079934 RepID=UPI0035259931